MFPAGWVALLAGFRIVNWTPFPAGLAPAGDATGAKGRSSHWDTSAKATMRTPVFGRHFVTELKTLHSPPLNPPWRLIGEQL
jgi:hypothetical protein